MLNLSAIGCDYCFLIGKYLADGERIPISGKCLSNIAFVFKNHRSILFANGFENIRKSLQK